MASSDKGKGHICRLSEEHRSGFNCFSDEQMVSILLHMDPDTLLDVGRTSKRMHRLVSDRKVWQQLLQGIENFAKEKVEELARFGNNGSPEMKAEVVKAAASKMNVLPHKYRLNVKVGVKGWSDTPETFEVDGGAIAELTRVASTVGASFTIQEVHCSKSISNSSTASILSRCVKHIHLQGETMENLELMSLPQKCAPKGFLKELFFTLVKLSNKWKIVHLDWFPHGCYLAGLSGDTSTGVWEWDQTISSGNIGSLLVDRGLRGVNLNSLKIIWRISDQVNILHNGQRIQVDGGKGDDPDGGWQHLVALHADVNQI